MLVCGVGGGGVVCGESVCVLVFVCGERESVCVFVCVAYVGAVYVSHHHQKSDYEH